jgi:hypothetical protein
MFGDGEKPLEAPLALASSGCEQLLILIDPDEHSHRRASALNDDMLAAKASLANQL